MRKFLKDESGATAVEYGLIVAVITVGISGFVFALGENIGIALDDASTCISNPTAENCGGPVD